MLQFDVNNTDVITSITDVSSQCPLETSQIRKKADNGIPCKVYFLKNLHKTASF